MFSGAGILFILMAVGSTMPMDISKEASLIKQLMTGYDSMIRPANSTSPAVVVALGLAMTEIVSLHEKTEIFESGAFLRHLWADYRLSWEPSKYGGITTVHLPASSVWKPDIVLINSVDIVTELQEPLVIVFHTGTVFYSPKMRLRTPCSLDLTKFPFDEQICTLVFGSWTYDKSNINLTDFAYGKNGLDLADLRVSREWNVMETLSVKSYIQFQYASNAFPRIQVSFRFQRNPTYYRHVFILPAVLLAILVPFQFLLPPDSKERMTLGGVLMLGIILLLIMLQDFLPEAHPTIPTLASYYSVTLIWIALSMMASIWVINTKSRGPRGRRVPDLMRQCVLRGLRRLVCLGDDSYFPLNEIDTLTMKTLDIPAVEPTVKPDIPGSPNKLEKDVEEILRHVQTMIICTKTAQARQEVQNEWRQVAVVFDRVLCFLFGTTFLLYTFVLLV
ncbi:neuronal acetylcholine receptor subunit alpha-6-like isoform X1 [Crassostrea virginica]